MLYNGHGKNKKRDRCPPALGPAGFDDAGGFRDGPGRRHRRGSFRATPILLGPRNHDGPPLGVQHAQRCLRLPPRPRPRRDSRERGHRPRLANGPPGPPRLRRPFRPGHGLRSPHRLGDREIPVHRRWGRCVRGRLLYAPQGPRSRRSGRLPEFRPSRRGRRLGRSDELVFLAARAVDRAHGPPRRGPPPPLPLPFLTVLRALPNAFRLWGRAVRRAAPRQPMDFVVLDGATANHNLVFGLLSTAAVILEGFLKWG